MKSNQISILMKTEQARALLKNGVVSVLECVSPNLTKKLKKDYLELKNIQIKNGATLDVIINQGKLFWFVSTDEVKVKAVK